jgi:hypothetical protein
MQNAYSILVGKSKGNIRDHLEYLVTDENIILGCILGKQVGKEWIGCVWLRIRTNGGLL